MNRDTRIGAIRVNSIGEHYSCVISADWGA